MQTEQVVIIGAGPAGLSAAIQLKRYGITPLLLEREETGGLLRNANLVENYPGFPGGISGRRLVQLFQEQALQSGVQVTAAEVTKLTWDGERFKVQTHLGACWAKIAVLASGTAPLLFTDLLIPAACVEHVSYEVYPFLEQMGKSFVIVGAGDAAFDYALNLAKENQVRILNRSDHIKCLPLLWERTQANKRISYQPMTQITSISPGPDDRITLKCSNSSGSLEFTANYLIGALGRKPEAAYLADELLKNARRLEQEGKLYWIGDVTNGLYRQTSIAVGDGVRAAMRIYQYLKENPV